MNQRMSLLAHRQLLLPFIGRLVGRKCQLIRFAPEARELAKEKGLLSYENIFLFALPDEVGGWCWGPLLAHETDEAVLDCAVRRAEADITDLLEQYREATRTRQELLAMRQRVTGVSPA